MLLVDASVWVSLVERESPHREAAMRLVREQGHMLSALDLTLYEVANAVGVKQGDADEASRVIRLLLRCCRDRVVPVDPDLLESALHLAAEHGLTAYDSAYVAAARRNGMTLVSTDIADLVSKGLAVTPDAADYP
ncbi:MAG TPA: type II toxin-antitoxin system VapC family toxin [Solirubrobacterales bacterium]|nr:type II toxin-antitoxin system VapC family toxin [Solirubrobacterales bacterium]